MGRDSKFVSDGLHRRGATRAHNNARLVAYAPVTLGVLWLGDPKCMNLDRLLSHACRSSIIFVPYQTKRDATRRNAYGVSASKKLGSAPLRRVRHGTDAGPVESAVKGGVTTSVGHEAWQVAVPNRQLMGGWPPAPEGGVCPASALYVSRG